MKRRISLCLSLEAIVQVVVVHLEDAMIVVVVMVIVSPFVVVVVTIVPEVVGLLNRTLVVLKVAVVTVVRTTPTPTPLRTVLLLQPLPAPLKALVVVAMGSSPNMVDDFVAAAVVAGLPKSTARVFPLPLQPLPSWAVVPRSRREQLRHKTRVRLVTLLNLVLTSLNAMASTVSQVGVVLHAPLMSSWTSSPHSVSSSYSSSSVSVSHFVPCVSSSLQHSILMSVFQRVRSFDLSVRRRGESVVSQSNFAEHSLIGLCDSLTQWLAALFTSLSPLSMSVDPSVVFSAFPLSFLRLRHFRLFVCMLRSSICLHHSTTFGTLCFVIVQFPL